LFSRRFFYPPASEYPRLLAVVECGLKAVALIGLSLRKKKADQADSAAKEARADNPEACAEDFEEIFKR
jgi:hypothetical protein